MRFDDTEIVISQRSTSDLLDMTLRLWGRYPARLALTYFVGCLPFYLLNMILVGWMVGSEALIAAELVQGGAILARWRHALDQVLLVFLELPLAGVLATTFLGQVTFKQNLSLAKIAQIVFRQWFTLLVVLGILRWAVVGPLILLFMPRTGTYDPLTELFLLAFLAVGFAVVARSFRPYAPEIIVLERCQLASRDKQQIRYGKRTQWLHAPVATECFARMMAIIILNMAGLISLLLTFLFFQGVFTGSWQWNWLLDWVVLPLVLWTLGGFATAFRFLCYLDTRIALEGWEVELLMRAEASRLAASQFKGVA